MTNQQLAAARRAVNGYPNIRIIKDGNTLTPVAKGGARGVPVEVTETMIPATLQHALAQSCESIA